MLAEVLNPEWLAAVTLVPVPPSVVRGDPAYDDRLLRILRELAAGRPLDIRERVVMTRSVEPSHLSEERVPIAELVQSMAIDPAAVEPLPASIGIFDDMLTTGRHFKAVEQVLRVFFPETPIVGVFIARRAPESTPI